MATSTITDRTVSSIFVSHMVNASAHNLTHGSHRAEEMSRVQTLLQRFAREVTHLALSGQHIGISVTSPSWKDEWRASSVRAMIEAGGEALVARTAVEIINASQRCASIGTCWIEETLRIIGEYCGQVGRLIALDINPRLLIMDFDEVNEYMKEWFARHRGTRIIIDLN